VVRKQKQKMHRLGLKSRKPYNDQASQAMTLLEHLEEEMLKEVCLGEPIG
jgi:hypothetical protein